MTRARLPNIINSWRTKINFETSICCSGEREWKKIGRQNWIPLDWCHRQSRANYFEEEKSEERRSNRYIMRTATTTYITDTDCVFRQAICSSSSRQINWLVFVRQEKTSSAFFVVFFFVFFFFFLPPTCVPSLLLLSISASTICIELR